MGIEYGDLKSVSLSKQIFKVIAEASYTASINMAKDRGAFPLWDYFKEKNNPFITRMLELLDEKTKAIYFAYGRRNIANLTIPPSGSISLLAGIASGIEPVYSVAHKRRRKVDADHPNASFKDKTGIWWEEYAVVHNQFLEWLRITKYPELSILDIRKILDKTSENDLTKLIKESPYNNSTSYEVYYRSKIDLQSNIQKFIDHAISNTLNLSKDSTVEHVSNAYINGWITGCKGITVYRDGSRQGVLLTSDSEREEFVEKDAPKRPKDLECDIFYPSIKGEHFLVLVGLYQNKPYEVFCFKNQHDFKSESKGILRKASRGIYNLMSESGDKILIEDITSFFEKPEEEFATRAISTGLRHGTPVRFMVEQLNKAEGDIFSYSKVIARTLKKYITDGIKVTSQTCPQCSHILTYVGGCIQCDNCGWSKC